MFGAGNGQWSPSASHLWKRTTFSFWSGPDSTPKHACLPCKHTTCHTSPPTYLGSLGCDFVHCIQLPCFFLWLDDLLASCPPGLSETGYHIPAFCEMRAWQAGRLMLTLTLFYCV